MLKENIPVFLSLVIDDLIEPNEAVPSCSDERGDIKIRIPNNGFDGV